MNDKKIVVAYPREIKFINKVGGSIRYSVDRKVSDYVNELQKDNDKLQSNWDSLKQILKEENYFEIVDKMNELEGSDK